MPAQENKKGASPETLKKLEFGAPECTVAESARYALLLL
jgi:hypothetical protein